MIVCYTSIYGGYDTLKPHPNVPWVNRWVCYTDDPTLSCDGWDVEHEPARFAHPRLSAKWRKCHPPEAQLSIWIDGSMVVNDPQFFAEMVGLLVKHEWAMFAHPERVSLMAEAAVSEQMVKYHGLPVAAQAAYYIDKWGWPDNVLWASTTMGRRHTPEVLQAGAAWFAENEHWTYQDQLSLPPVIDRYDIDVGALQHTLWRNPWFKLAGHSSDQ
jgi:hypothetical protein